MLLTIVVCCKQETAYEMRISDWSSDVCSSDLRRNLQRQGTARGRRKRRRRGCGKTTWRVSYPRLIAQPIAVTRLYASGGVTGIKRGGDAADLPRQQIIGAGGGAAVPNLQRHSLGGQCIVQRPPPAAERRPASQQPQDQSRISKDEH